jgi:transcriptional regulator GlxA family with amidase domain
MQRAQVVAVLGTPRASTSAIFVILDVLSSVGRDWEILHGRGPRAPTFRPLLLSFDGCAYVDPNGFTIQPQGSIAEHPAPDIVIVPDLHLDPVEPLPNSFAPFVDWLRTAHANGATVSSICSGAMLLAQTGLLDGQDATTHWGYYDAISRHFPRVRLRRERILVPAGEGHRVITAGGASAWGDLLLYLIGRIAGQEEARRIARLYLFQPHTEGQLHYASLTAGRQHTDAVIAAAQVWLADNYATPNPVAAMAERSGLSERSFLRRFRRATGQSPVEYVQTLRIEEAKQMLEATDMGLDDIAAEVGYAEPSSFRQVFRKHVGMTASAYRRQRLPALESFAAG